MGKPKPILLLFIVLVVLTANVNAKAKKACKLLGGTCIKKGGECDGQQVQHKTFCKGGSKYSCCYPVEQKSCSTPEPPTTAAPKTTASPASQAHTEPPNPRPVIGILAQNISHSMRTKVPELAQYSQYIAASYVKYMESGGARVVPILVNQTYDYYVKMVNSLNGVIFPGGSSAIYDVSGYGTAGGYLYDLILASGEAGNPVPLWGTCLGFQMLCYCLKQKRGAVLTKRRAYYVNYPLELEDWEGSQFLGSAPDSVMDPLKTMDITGNFHNYSVIRETWEKYDMSGKNYRILSVNHNDKGEEFISTIEHRTLPIFGTQWHVEKNAYEWKYDTTPHFSEAIHIGHYFAQLFVDYARQNTNSFKNKDNITDAAEERKYLIYNHDPIFLEPFKEEYKYGSPWMQGYYFNGDEHNFVEED